MGPLRKLTITNLTDANLAVGSIQWYVNTHNYTGFIMSDATDKIITNPNKKFTHQNFNGSDVFISAQSFQQNNQDTGNQIRKYVANLIAQLKPQQITCIGGESYLYGLTGLIRNVHAYTNSSSIYDDIGFNARFITSCNCKAYLCDYNQINQIETSPICLINLSSLNAHLLKVINARAFNQIIIISCHHEDFWKKIKYLSNYKVKVRKQFVACSLGYFLTVNVLVHI